MTLSNHWCNVAGAGPTRAPSVPSAGPRAEQWKLRFGIRAEICKLPGMWASSGAPTPRPSARLSTVVSGAPVKSCVEGPGEEGTGVRAAAHSNKECQVFTGGISFHTSVPKPSREALGSERIPSSKRLLLLLLLRIPEGTGGHLLFSATSVYVFRFLLQGSPSKCPV